MPMKRVRTFSFLSETPGAYKYSEDKKDGKGAATAKDPDMVVGTLYIRKTAMKGKPASSLKVTIESE